MAEGRNPFNVKCGKCQHVWTAAWLPMEMALFAKVTGNQRCPSCGNGPKQIFVAPGEATTTPASSGETTS